MELAIGKKGISILNLAGKFSIQDHLQVSVDNGVLHISINLKELLHLGADESSESCIASTGVEVLKKDCKVDVLEPCNIVDEHKVCIGNNMASPNKVCHSLVNSLPIEDAVDMST